MSTWHRSGHAWGEDEGDMAGEMDRRTERQEKKKALWHLRGQLAKAVGVQQAGDCGRE